MTKFFIIKTKFFTIMTISFTIKTISLQSCHVDSSTPKGVGDDRPIIDTRRGVSLHAGRLEYDKGCLKWTVDWMKRGGRS